LEVAAGAAEPVAGQAPTQIGMAGATKENAPG